VIGAALGAVAARAAYAAFRRRPTLGDEKTAGGSWTRVNYRGEPVTLLEGPALAAGAATAAVLAPGLPGRARAAALLAGVCSGALGAYDDVFGTSSSKGFKGHLSALARGEVTSGAVKILGIGAAGLAAAALSPRQAEAGGPVSRVADTLIDGGLIAGSANLANLFDLRPGRAIKVGLLAGAPLLAASLASPYGARSREAAVLTAVPLGAAAALLPEDLGERAMLGDAGANGLGALLGLAATARLGRPGRLALLGAVVALTAASEKVSFTKVIAGNPVLNRLDLLGRRPAQAHSGTARPTA
jgi:UDP-N-acetylmuramyl pentapeptide phosphotransferase/UDP-N-acetylglucosamine-1-phosphate transferase